MHGKEDAVTWKEMEKDTGIISEGRKVGRKEERKDGKKEGRKKSGRKE